jgi:hypothetical protein
MPNNTINFNLPYPSGVDPPCDFAEQWCDFTEAIDGVFATFQSAIDRAIPVVPLAIVRQTISRGVFNFALIPFDTVTADTAAMVDVDADPFHIVINRPGRYTVACALSKPTTGFSLPRPTSVASTPSLAQAALLDRGAGLEYFLNGFYAVATFAAGDKVGLSFSVGNQNTWTIDESWLAVIWHSDTEVP